MILTRAAARALLLASQHVLHPPAPHPTKADVRATIRQMAILQIDTIHVVARSPYLVLWSRLGSYSPVWLDELLAEGSIFEYWSHEACFLPVEHYPLYRSLMLHGRARSWGSARRWAEEHPHLLDQMRQHIQQHGAVRSADFTRTDGQKSGWWNWKDEKIALEMLFSLGDVMVARRHNFQRVYDLRERVLPDWNDADAPSPESVLEQFALLTVRALGVAVPHWVPDYFRTRGRADGMLAALAVQGKLLSVSIAGFDGPAYIHPDNAALAEQAAAGTLVPTHTTLLSPFDPVVWDRRRARELFDFDYRIECYTPAPKRQYGYFTLPILHRGRLVGRLDPKAHRKDGVFEVKALAWEPDVTLDEELIGAVAGALRGCAAWHGTPDIQLGAGVSAGREHLMQALAAG